MISTTKLRPWGEVGLGGSAWSIRAILTPDRVTTVVAAALERGIRLFDTARAYTTVDEAAHNERLLGVALRSVASGEHAVVISKGGHFRIDAQTWGIDATPPALRADCHASLRALGRERIDVYLLHHPDPKVPIEDSVGALDELRREGLVGAIGVSNVDSGLLERAMRAAPIAVVENRLSPFDLGDRPTVETCERLGVSYVAYSALGGRRRPGDLRAAFSRTYEIADRLGLSAFALWLAWLRRESSAITPLIGATRPESVRDSAAAADGLLTELEWMTMDAEISAFGSTGQAKC